MLCRTMARMTTTALPRPSESRAVRETAGSGSTTRRLAAVTTTSISGSRRSDHSQTRSHRGSAERFGCHHMAPRPRATALTEKVKLNQVPSCRASSSVREFQCIHSAPSARRASMNIVQLRSPRSRSVSIRITPMHSAPSNVTG